MNEHTDPYIDSKSGQESKELKKKQSPERKENEGTKTKEETEKYILEMELYSGFSFHNSLAFYYQPFNTDSSI